MDTALAFEHDFTSHHLGTYEWNALQIEDSSGQL
jgi:hypothetical protein